MRIMRSIGLMLALVPISASAHDMAPGPAAASACTGHGLACASVATPAFGNDGRLWLVWQTSKRIVVGSSTDLGRTFVESAVLPEMDLPLDNGPDARPKIVIRPSGEQIVTFATRDDKYNGHAYIARSRDDGKTFSAPLPITSGSPSQRFETVAIDGEGNAVAFWIDKRNSAAAKRGNQPYAGAALAFSWLDQNGAPTGGNIAKDSTCECCRIAVDFAGPGRPVVMFRNIFEGGIRDHAVMTFSDRTRGEITRVSDDDAKTDACPHHGPSLSIGPDGVYHASWFAAGRKLKGVFYARSGDAGRSFSEPMRLGRGDDQIARPNVLAQKDAAYLVYKAFDGTRTRLELRVSVDAGKTWREPSTLAETADESDHPLLVAGDSGVYVSWLTRAEGYKLIKLEAGK